MEAKSFENLDYSIQKIQYSNGNHGIRLLDSNFLPIAELSLNIPGIKLKNNEFILKNYSENKDLAQELLEKKIIKKTGKIINISRNLSCPVCRILNDPVQS